MNIYNNIIIKCDDDIHVKMNSGNDDDDDAGCGLMRKTGLYPLCCACVKNAISQVYQGNGTTRYYYNDVLMILRYYTYVLLPSIHA